MTAATAAMNARGDRPRVYYGVGSYSGQCAATVAVERAPLTMRRSVCGLPPGVRCDVQLSSLLRSQHGSDATVQRGVSTPSTVTLQPGSAKSTTAPGRQPPPFMCAPIASATAVIVAE